MTHKMTNDDGNVDVFPSWVNPVKEPPNLVPVWSGKFDSFGEWVSFATTRLAGATGSTGQSVPAICVDAKGRRCNNGKDFARARDDDSFPVYFFWEMEEA